MEHQKTKNLLNENSDTNPQTGYSLNKLQIEQDLETIASKIFPHLFLRFATIFGVSPRMRFDIVINMLVGMGLTEKEIKLNSDGTAWRPNLYILKMLVQLLRALSNMKNKVKIIKF